MAGKTKSIEKIGRVSSASILKCTGKDWDAWIKILSKQDAESWTHKETVAFLRKKYKPSPWWEQGIAHGFELHIGKKQENRNAKGQYSHTATKSFPIDHQKTWKLLFSEEGQAIWLKPMYFLKPIVKSPFELDDGTFGEIRTIRAPGRVRMSWKKEEWEKPSYLEIAIVPRPGGKSIVVFQHNGLSSAQINEQHRARWKKALTMLRASV